MMKLFEEPKIEVIAFPVENVMYTDSSVDRDPDEGAEDEFEF